MRKALRVLCWRLAVPFLVFLGSATPCSTLAAALPGLPVPAYILTGLGALNGYSSSGGAALNAWGHVAADALPSDPVNVPSKAFLFRCGHRIDVGPRLDPANPADCSSAAINGADEVLGNVTPRDGSPGKAFLYRHGKVLTFSVPGSYTGAFGLNALGQVVGYFVPGPNFDSSRAFLRQPDGKLLDLGTFGGTSASANAINALGQIAGEVDDAQGGYPASRAATPLPRAATTRAGAPAISGGARPTSATPMNAALPLGNRHS
ncbi:MAG TPA: hypothetical protein VGD78_15095 [Chthoniobacterales bacterium]